MITTFSNRCEPLGAWVHVVPDYDGGNDRQIIGPLVEHTQDRMQVLYNNGRSRWITGFNDSRYERLI